MPLSTGLAVVIGGGNGIGEAAARLFSARGWNVVVGDRDAGAARHVATSLGAISIEIDIASEPSVAAAQRQLDRHDTPVTALVVTAAVFQDVLPPGEFAMAAWDNVIRVNLTGTYLANRAFGTAMARRGCGSIVNIASIAALGSFPVHAYAAAKRAVVSLTEGLAGEWGRSGVRVNAVSPGSTLVPRVADRIASGRYAAHPGTFTALGRAVEPNEVAEAIEFLASDRASAITGVNLVVDAGWEVASTWAQYGGVRPPAAGVT